MAKIKPTVIPKGGKKIPAPREPEDRQLRFSFKLLDISSDKFGLHHCPDTNYWEKLLLRLQDVSRTTLSSFRGLPTKQLRNHKIIFKDTSEPAGFSTLTEQLREQEAWQFQLTRDEHGRVHGLLIDEVFYVVWLDPCHKLYSKQNTKCHAR